MYHLLLAVIYLSFISLGLPDSVLGSAWPTIYPKFGVPVSYAGIIYMIISGGTVISSLQSDRLTKRAAIESREKVVSQMSFCPTHHLHAVLLFVRNLRTNKSCRKMQQLFHAMERQSSRDFSFYCLAFFLLFSFYFIVWILFYRLKFIYNLEYPKLFTIASIRLPSLHIGQSPGVYAR